MQAKFKIGNLVRVKIDVVFDYDIKEIKAGSIGLVTEIEYIDESLSLFGGSWDYIVLVGGRTYFFFEEELELIV